MIDFVNKWLLINTTLIFFKKKMGGRYERNSVYSNTPGSLSQTLFQRVVPEDRKVSGPRPQVKARQTHWSVPHSWLPTPAPLCGSRHTWTSCHLTAGTGSASPPPASMSPRPHLLALPSTGSPALGIPRPSDSWAAVRTILATPLPSTGGLTEGELQNTREHGLSHRLRWATGWL